MSLNIKELKQMHKNYKDADETIFLVIFNRCKELIKLNSKLGQSSCVFDVPTYIFGYPPFDLEVCMEFLLKKLTSQIIATRMTNISIYCSWKENELKK